jgi:hypothetical protein
MVYIILDLLGYSSESPLLLIARFVQSCMISEQVRQ